MTDKQDEKNKTQAATLVIWIIGSFVIFLVASVTYFYFGWEGEVAFQVHGLMVALIIANYTHKTFRFIGEEGDNDIQK